MRLDHLLSKEEEVRVRSPKGPDVFHCPGIDTLKDLAAIRMGATPVPMPNTTVKTRPADGTALETVRKSRWPPEFKNVILSGREATRAYSSAG